MKISHALTASLAAGSLLLLTACGSSSSQAEAKPEAAGPDKVTVQLDYQVRGNHAMFQVAKDKGYFKDEGIDVTAINIGTGSPNTLRLVGTGGADFGFADLPSLVTARTQDVPVKAIAAVNQVSPLGLCSLKDNVELTSPASLQGKTMGVHTAGSTYIFYQALLAKNGIDKKSVKELTVTPPFENYLMQKQVDAVVCYEDAEVPLLEQHAGGKDKLSILRGSDFGYDAYGSGLFTTDKLIESNPDLVQRFTNAYLKAFDWVAQNPDDAAALLAGSSPELADKKDLFAAQLKADVDFTFTSDQTKKQGLGAMDEQRWKSTIGILADQKVIKSTPETSAVYTNEFIENSKAN
ncbi:ABC transporter substrate-binding protein [Arthrobacter sp. I2-34]|uniref:ABC transporter substrate-binding protein n=1 Tax=Arthrobacter hankyongi TaxID=2904801 RepID=A0ABS9L778_9MICC|nr:ABC transporter substrate-binding protein [Arthrobacter hankyongi]MCG2622531.1 ABC transporter substrate-binding protein [Arthrobacter hankyongi]